VHLVYGAVATARLCGEMLGQYPINDLSEAEKPPGRLAGIERGVAHAKEDVRGRAERPAAGPIIAKRGRRVSLDAPRAQSYAQGQMSKRDTARAHKPLGAEPITENFSPRVWNSRDYCGRWPAGGRRAKIFVIGRSFFVGR